jgi:hypothetical protein
VRVIVNVGALAPEPSAARILAHYEKRLHIDVHGTAYAVRRWYRAIMETTSEALL